jgi:hypothetical protein
MLQRIFTTVVALAVAYVAVTSLSDIARYPKMREI